MTTDTKPTTREFQGFIRARREWISENDAYNVAHFGLTKATYARIQARLTSAYGIMACGEGWNVAELRRLWKK